MTLRVASLFSGIGGFDLGFERAGAEVIFQCELDKNAQRVLRAHWPEVPLHDDITTLERGPVADVYAGGFPCQDVSVAGRRAGLAGERSGLWFEFHRLLSGARPRWVVIENVPGLLSSHRGRDFSIVLQGLVDLGYRVAWRVLDAQYFGLAQRRKRVFIVGSLGDGRCAEVLFERESVPGDPPARRAAGEAIAGTLGDSSQSGGFRTTDLDNSGAFVFDPTQVTSPGNRSQPEPGGPCHTLPAAGRAPHIGSVPAVAWALQERDAKGPDSDTKEGHLLPVTGGVRRLTSRECERLQGFPDDWTAVSWTQTHSLAGRPLKKPVIKHMVDSHRYRQLGNAVAVPVAEWIARRIIAVDAQQ